MTQETNEVNVVGVRPDGDYSGVPTVISVEDDTLRTTVGTQVWDTHVVQPPAGEIWRIRTLGSFLGTGTAGTQVEHHITDGDVKVEIQTNSDDYVHLVYDGDLLVTNSRYVLVRGYNPDTASTYDLVTHYVGVRVK